MPFISYSSQTILSNTTAVSNLFIEEIKAALVSGKGIELRGFGTFEVRIRKGRQKARNPKTGEIVSVGSHGIASFRPGRELKQDVWVQGKDKKDDQENPGSENAAALAK